MGHRILLFDSDQDTLNVFRAVLTNLQYAVCCAVDGESALRCLAVEAPDLILMERPSFIPGGAALTTALRRDPRHASVRVLVVTARPIPAEPGDDDAENFDALLIKPVQIGVLRAEIERLIGPPPADLDVSPQTLA